MNHYMLFLSSLFFFEQHLRVLNQKVSKIKQSNKLYHNIIIRNQRPLEEKDKQYLDYPDYPEDKDDDIFIKYEKLVESEKEMKEKYETEFTKYTEQQNHLKKDSIYMLLLIIII